MFRVLICLWIKYICLVNSATVNTNLKTLFYGSVTENVGGILFSIEEVSLLSATITCISRCQSVRQCIGLEICKIGIDRYRCRACCSWMKDKRTSTTELTSCQYFQMVNIYLCIYKVTMLRLL